MLKTDNLRTSNNKASISTPQRRSKTLPIRSPMKVTQEEFINMEDKEDYLYIGEQDEKSRLYLKIPDTLLLVEDN